MMNPLEIYFTHSKIRREFSNGSLAFIVLFMVAMQRHFGNLLIVVFVFFLKKN